MYLAYFDDINKYLSDEGRSTMTETFPTPINRSEIRRMRRSWQTCLKMILCTILLFDQSEISNQSSLQNLHCYNDFCLTSDYDKEEIPPTSEQDPLLVYVQLDVLDIQVLR